MTRSSRLFGLLAVLLLTTPTRIALANEPEAVVQASPPEADTQPWSANVSEAQKADAQRLLEQGNAQFVRNDHRAALASYQAALAFWDHPAIRFNVARSLIQLDRAVEAYENLEQALRYGPLPLEENVYAEARGYLQLLRSQVGELDVRCQQKGAEVAIDGKALLACPGSQHVRVLPGSHLLVASLPGFLTLTKNVLVMPGAVQTLDLKLVSIGEATRTERRWAVWKPWSVFAAGVVTVGVAGLLRWKAKDNYDAYGDDLARLCGESPCKRGDLPASTRQLEERAQREDRSAIALFATGAALSALGVTLVFLNQPRTVLPKAEPALPTLTPSVTRQGFGASLSGRF